jgi:hypothetical protein
LCNLKPEHHPSCRLLGTFIDGYLAGRTDIKPRTRINFGQVRRDLVAHFGKQRLLRDVMTPGCADALPRWLLTREKKLGENTVRRHCGRAKQLFRVARRKRLIAENPFADMKGCAVQANKSRECFITRETELTETFPLHVVTAWLGNSQLIAAEHYLQVTDSHFEDATRAPLAVRQNEEIAGWDGNGVIRPLRENEKAPEFPGLPASDGSFRYIHINPVPPTGVEPVS